MCYIIKVYYKNILTHEDNEDDPTTVATSLSIENTEETDKSIN